MQSDPASHPIRDVRCSKCHALRASPIAICERCPRVIAITKYDDPPRPIAPTITDGMFGAIACLVIAAVGFAGLFANPAIIDSAIARLIAMVIS